MKYTATIKKFALTVWTNYAAIYGLWGIAIGYPYITTLVNYPEFTTAHHLGPTVAIITIAILLFILPTVVAGCRFLFGKISTKAANYFDYGYCLLMSYLIISYEIKGEWLNSIFSQDWACYVYVTSCLFSAMALVALFHINRTRDLFRFAAIVPIILSIYYLSSSAMPVRKDSSYAKKTETGKIGSPAPVVILILDEFALWALLDKDGNIDHVRFPNLAAFADTSTWFRRARTLVPVTVYALPIIDTGIATHLQPYQPPDLKNFPNNLFSWLAGQYENFNICEAATSLSPDLISANSFNPEEYISDMFFFSYYFYMEKIISKTLKTQMPKRWCGFNKPRQEKINEWIQRLRGGRSLNFLHILIPHSPLRYNFDGNKYDRTALFKTAKNNKINHPSAINMTQHLYMIQCGYADKCAGQIIAELKNKNIFDSALIIIMADHGLTFAPNLHNRGGLSPQGMAEAGFIPLLIKRPFQHKGEISDRQATSLDIMPTICSTLKATQPWAMDGYDLFSSDFPVFDHNGTNKRLYCFPSSGGPADYKESKLSELLPYLENKTRSIAELFGNHQPFIKTPVNYTEQKEYNVLLGCNIESLRVKNCNASAKIRISNSLFVEGYMENLPTEMKGYLMAMAIKNQIFIITSMYNRDLFCGMFPGADLSPSTLSVFMIEKHGGEITLHRISRLEYLPE